MMWMAASASSTNPSEKFLRMGRGAYGPGCNRAGGYGRIYFHDNLGQSLIAPFHMRPLSSGNGSSERAIVHA